MERPEGIMREIPEQMTKVRLLLAQVRRPEPQAGLGPPLHTGAIGYFDKISRLFSWLMRTMWVSILTAVLMVSSWVWELKRWVQSSRRIQPTVQ